MDPMMATLRDADRELGLTEADRHYAISAIAYARDLPMGSTASLEKLLYKQVAQRYHPNYFREDGSYKLGGSLALWVFAGKVIWQIVVWVINRRKGEQS